MDFSPSPAAADHLQRLRAFMEDSVYPAERDYADYRRAAGPEDHTLPPVVEALKSEARRRGLWNLFLPAVSGLTHTDYAQLAEITGRSHVLAPEAVNCAAPDSGNMELLHMFASSEQRARWLEPLLDGRIRSAFAMTEPEVASSDATNIRTRIHRVGDDYVLDGRKWWITGAADERCRLLIVLGVSEPGAERHRRHSIILVPRDAPGVKIIRSLPVFGYQDQHGHCEIEFDQVRIPVANLLGSVGDGFKMAQARLGPGRVHHAMRAIGMAERAMDMMRARAAERTAFGQALLEKATVLETLAECRLAIEQARLLVLRTAWTLDQEGPGAARADIAAIKLAAPRMATRVIDEAIQLHGALGISGDTPLAEMWTHARTLRIVDGPDAVHPAQLGKLEARRPGNEPHLSGRGTDHKGVHPTWPPGTHSRSARP